MRNVLFTGVLALWAGALMAAQQPKPAQPAAPTCARAEHSQFDFWIGEWEVVTPDGKVAGRNSITKELGGCVIHEHWKGAGGMTGESFNIWDRTNNKWHQTWVSSRGDLLLLDGAYQDGAMRMTGTSTSPDGKQVANRITWTPSGKESVRQLWEVSADGGHTWRTIFDGKYRRAQH